MFVFIAVDGIELEATGQLLLETGDRFLLGSSPLEEGAISILDENPLPAILYAYQHESFTFQAGNPDEATEPRYFEAWQNQPTTTMVIRPSQSWFGNYYTWQDFVIQLATPTFDPDGTAVTPPTRTKASPRVGTGKTSTRRPGA
jgi:hypothetical protein